jgi:hypothetical protein
MANDFDNDDLSWLRNSDSGQDDTSSSDDDMPDFDWLLDEDEQNSSRAGTRSTGVTGQLPWQQGSSDETTSGDQSGRLGVTGELDWRRASGQQQDLESLFAGMDTPDEWASNNADWDTPEEVFADTDADPEAVSTRSSVAGSAAMDDDEDEIPDWLQGMLEDAEADNESVSPAASAGISEAQPDSFFDFGEADNFEETFDGAVHSDAASLESPSEALPDWLLNAAPPAAQTSPASETDEDDADALFGLFDDMALDDPDAELEFDELNFDDVPAPSAYASVGTEIPEDADEELFASLLASRQGEAIDDSVEDEIVSPEIFSTESLQGFEDYSPLEVPGALGNSGSSVGDDFFSIQQAAEDQSEAEERQEFDFDALPSSSPEPFSSALSGNDDSLQWMSDLESLDDLSQAPTRETDIEDVDDFLASLGPFQESAPPSTSDVESDLMVAGDDIDFNRLLSDPAFADFDTEVEDVRNSFERPAPAPDSPEWLADVRIQEVSASALVRQQQDRPVEELPSRLRALRERGLDLPTVESGDREPAAPVLDPSDAAAAVPQGQTGQIALSQEQASRVALLRSITHSDVQPVEARPQGVGNVRSRLARIIAALLIAGGVLIPFVSSFRIGNLPPSSFAVGSQQQAVFAAVDDLNPGELVLFAAEYGGSNAGELDGLADVLLRHTILRGGVPVVISTNPIGLLRMDRNLMQIGDGRLVRNRDYYIGRYIAGDDIGLRNLSQEIGSFTSTDSNGRATNLNITSLDDFAAIVIITGEVGSVRNWSEQVAPLTQSPMLFAVSSSVSPVAQPYANAAGVGALLIGYRDSYTYADRVNALIDAGAVPPLIKFDTETPTPVETEDESTATQTPEPEIIATEEAATGESDVVTGEQTLTATTDDVATQVTEQAVTSTSTVEPDEEVTATDEDAEVTATATLLEETPEPSPTVTPISEIDATSASTEVIFGRVISDQTVNVRSGPGTDFSPVGVLEPGERFEVLGENDDGTWVNVQLADGTRGWVFAQLVEIESPTSWLMPPQIAVSMLNLGGLGLGSQSSAALLIQQPVIEQVATRTPRPTATDTEAASEEASVIVGTPSAQDDGSSGGLDLRVELPYREERWYGMTFGILVIVLVIVTGNILGLLSRRSVRSEQRDR